MPRFAHRTSLAALAPLVVCAACAASLVTAVALAAPGERPTAAQCSASYESAQLLRQTGKLIAAREAAASCARSSCPDVVRQDCSTWAGEIEKQIPSVIVIARDAATGDERGAKVIVDGAERPEAATGRAFELDPGTHAVRIERAGDQLLEQTITVVQGERDRVLRFVLRAAASTVPAVSVESTGAHGRDHASYLPAAIVGGAAVLVLGTSAWLGLSGRSELSGLRGSCAPSCADDQVDPVRRRLIASDVLLGVGILAAAASLYLVVRPPSSGSEPAAHLGLAPSRDGARVTFVTTF